MKPIRYKLLDIIERLPLHARLYTAMHNLWGVLFCAVGTPSKVRLDKVLCKMEYNTESVSSVHHGSVHITDPDLERLSSAESDTRKTLAYQGGPLGGDHFRLAYNESHLVSISTSSVEGNIIDNIWVTAGRLSLQRRRFLKSQQTTVRSGAHLVRS